MRIFVIPLIALAACVIGFFAGRASAPDLVPPPVPASNGPTATPPALAALSEPTPDGTTSMDARANLLRALEQSDEKGDRDVRLAMNAWLATDGAAAIAAVRNDPEISVLARRMTLFALYMYPEIFLEDPSILEGDPHAGQLITMAVNGMAIFDPDAARALVAKHLTGSMFSRSALFAIEQTEQLLDPPALTEDPRAQLQAVLAERNPSYRFARLQSLVSAMAASDPAAAAQLIDELPLSAFNEAAHPLIESWARTNPQAAARWLANKDAQVARAGLNQLATSWGHQDFRAADAFVDTLTGAQRAAFLTGLAGAASDLPNNEMLAWISRYEYDPIYPDLVESAASLLAWKDAGAAVSMLDGLQEEVAHPSFLYAPVLSISFMQDPEAAIAAVEAIKDESLREKMAPTVASVWAQNDAQSALDWALDLRQGSGRDNAIASVAHWLMQFEVERAADVISKIEDPATRTMTAMQLVALVESEAEAIRLGRTFDLNQNIVLELRKERSARAGPPGVRFSAFLSH